PVRDAWLMPVREVTVVVAPATRVRVPLVRVKACAVVELVPSAAPDVIVSVPPLPTTDAAPVHPVTSNVSAPPEPVRDAASMLTSPIAADPGRVIELLLRVNVPGVVAAATTVSAWVGGGVVGVPPSGVPPPDQPVMLNVSLPVLPVRDALAMPDRLTAPPTGRAREVSESVQAWAPAPLVAASVT